MSLLRISKYTFSGHLVMICKIGGSYLRVNIDDNTYITRDRKTVAKIWRKEQQCQNAPTKKEEEKRVTELFKVINQLKNEDKLLPEPLEDTTEV